MGFPRSAACFPSRCGARTPRDKQRVFQDLNRCFRNRNVGVSGAIQGGYSHEAMLPVKSVSPRQTHSMHFPEDTAWDLPQAGSRGPARPSCTHGYRRSAKAFMPPGCTRKGKEHTSGGRELRGLLVLDPPSSGGVTFSVTFGMSRNLLLGY